MKRKSFEGAVYECSLKSFLPLDICIIQFICEKEKQMAKAMKEAKNNLFFDTPGFFICHELKK